MKYMSTRELLKENWAAMEAYKDGKDIQVADRRKEPLQWSDYNSEYPDFTNSNWKWRIKPTPTLRPWRAEEVPVGALIRWKIETKHCYDGMCGFDICLIAGVHTHRVLTSIHASNYSFDNCLKMFEHSLDHGKTWLPCGVVE